MLLGVGEKEVEQVTARYRRLTEEEKLFPSNELLDRFDLSVDEPALVA